MSWLYVVVHAHNPSTQRQQKVVLCGQHGLHRVLFLPRLNSENHTPTPNESSMSLSPWFFTLVTIIKYMYGVQVTCHFFIFLWMDLSFCWPVVLWNFASEKNSLFETQSTPYPCFHGHTLPPNQFFYSKGSWWIAQHVRLSFVLKVSLMFPLALSAPT